MRSSRQGAIPSELGWLVDELDSTSERLRTLEAPSGEALAGIVARSVLPAPIYANDASAPITSAPTVLAQAIVPVPSGFTRAVINVTARVTVRSNGALGSSASLQCAAIIPGAGGSSSNAIDSVGGQLFGTTSATSAAVVDSLPPGSSISVHALASFAGSYTVAGAAVAGSVLFLR